MGKMGHRLKAILFFPKIRELGPRMKFHGDILNWANGRLGL
jgi:hypothetical protein